MRRRPTELPQRIPHRGGKHDRVLHPNQLWFLEVSQPLPQSYRKPDSARIHTGSPRTPANHDSEKHYFMLNSHGTRHSPRTAPSAPLQEKWSSATQKPIAAEVPPPATAPAHGEGPLPAAHLEYSTTSARPTSNLSARPSSNLSARPSSSLSAQRAEALASLRVSPTTVPESAASDEAEALIEAVLQQRLFPPRASPSPPTLPARQSPPRSRRAAERADPSGLCRIGTPRTRKMDTGGGGSGAEAAAPYQVEGSGAPMGPGRFERWGRGRGPPSSSCGASCDASPRGSRAERGRLPIAPSPAAAPPATADYATDYATEYAAVAEESSRLLATAAAAAGVVPALVPPATQAGPSGVSTFQSSALRLAVTVAEQLDSAERAAAGAPSARSVAICLHLLEEMTPLMGPLEVVALRLTAALRRCLLSDRHYSLDGQHAEQPLTYFELVSRLEEDLAKARREADAARAEVRLGGDEVAELQRELQETQAALRTQREEREREKQSRGRHDRDISLHRDEASAAQHAMDVLQGEAVAQHREHTQMIIALESKVELLSKEKEHLRNALAAINASPEPVPTPRRGPKGR